MKKEDMKSEGDSLKNDAPSLVAPSSTIDKALLEEIMTAGVLYGRKKSKTNPKMRKYIHSTRNGFQIFDAEKIMDLGKKSEDFLKSVAAKGGSFLIVGTEAHHREPVKAFALKLGVPNIANRWLGGILTNFKTLQQRLQYYLKLKSDLETGRLDKYTKKERVQFGKDAERLEKLFSGLENFTKIPSVLIVVGATSHMTAVREAKRLKIPVVAIVSTDCDPEIVDYIFPGNDRSKSSIAWILDRFATAIEQGVKEMKANVVSAPSETKKQ